MFNQAQQKALLQLVRDTIGFKLNRTAFVTPDDPAFHENRGLFVTLHKAGELRGCIGYVQAYKDILTTVKEMALAAAFKDPRFPAVTAKELDSLEIEISILSEMRQVCVSNTLSIEIGRDGLYLVHPYGSGLLLPQVAVEQKWDLHTYLKEICHKAGLPSRSYKDAQAVLYRFTAEVFREEPKNSG